MAEPFDEQMLLAGAAAQVQGADFGPGDFREPLAVYLGALRSEARVNQPGTWRLVHRTIMSLKRRAQLEVLLAREPAIREAALPAPVIIVGFPRTGTTLLHNLMAADPAHRALRLWEARSPFAPVDAGPQWQESVIEQTRQLLRVAHEAAPRLARIHPMNATWPDECSWLLRNQFTTMVLAFSAFIPSYVRFLMNRDVTRDYAYYALQLRAILHQRPGAPLILKDPCHLWHLDALLDTFPAAKVVHLHRPIEQVVGSFCSLCHAIQEADTELRPLPELGAYAVDMLRAAMERMLEVRAIPDARFIDLPYAELTADPAGCVRRLYQRLELPFTDAAAAGVAGWLEQGRALGGRNEYTLAHYGLEAEAMRDLFAPYRRRFETYLSPGDPR